MQKYRLSIQGFVDIAVKLNFRIPILTHFLPIRHKAFNSPLVNVWWKFLKIWPLDIILKIYPPLQSLPISEEISSPTSEIWKEKWALSTIWHSEPSTNSSRTPFFLVNPMRMERKLCSPWNVKLLPRTLTGNEAGDLPGSKAWDLSCQPFFSN